MKPAIEYIEHEPGEVTFDDWYNAYPKKANKQKARKLWDKLSDKNKHFAIVDVPKRLEQHSQWHEKTFIPAPDVYLRNHKWNDEIVTRRTLEDKQEQAEDGTPLARFWTLLRQMYGERWVRAYGDQVPFMWRKKLHDMTNREIARVLNYLAAHPAEYLPDLPLIMRIRSIGFDFGTHKKLIGNPSKPETVSAAIAAMNEALR